MTASDNFNKVGQDAVAVANRKHEEAVAAKRKKDLADSYTKQYIDWLMITLIADVRSGKISPSEAIAELMRGAGLHSYQLSPQELTQFEVDVTAAEQAFLTKKAQPKM